jgi:hypothetical protein
LKHGGIWQSFGNLVILKQWWFVVKSFQSTVPPGKSNRFKMENWQSKAGETKIICIAVSNENLRENLTFLC